MKILLITSILVLAILGILTNDSVSAQIQVDPASIYLNDNGSYVPYKIIQNPNSTTILSREGSYVFDKTSCVLSFYNTTNTNNSPVIPYDGYSVLASFGNTNTWNPVSVIDNAVCNTFISENQGTVTLTGTKSVPSAGSFSVIYTKAPTKALKYSFSATNNNPSWTNYHIGLRETVIVPKNIMLGNQTYDLSQYNNTVLNRNWITNHNAQLIRLTSNSHYDMGLGWNYASSITIHYINNQAILTIDYTNNTPILSPGNTITVDPSITSDTSATCTTDAATTCNITIGSNSNRILIVSLHEAKNANTISSAASTVKIGTTSFTKITNKTGDGSSYSQNHELWYLLSPPTGAQTVTITWSVAPVYSTIGLLSLYNVDQTQGINTAVTNSTSGTVNANIRMNITPAHAGSWIVANTGSQQGCAAPSNTGVYTNTADSGAVIGSCLQYNSSPTIGSKNILSWTTGTTTATGFSSIAIEILKNNPKPSTPSLTHADVLSSTSILLDWSSVINGTWYTVNYTSPASGTFSQLVNQSGITYNATGLTPGTQYAFKVNAGNGSGGGTFSPYKSNYTSNIAPTSPVISNIAATTSTISVTNPTGNFSGYKIYIAPASTGIYTLSTTTSTTSNTASLTGLNDDTAYTAKLSTRYAVGTNSSGVSSNSTTVAWSTLPNSPGGLALSQSVVNALHLSWSAPTGLVNPVLGYKIERSIDYGTTWITLVSNTGNTGITYDDTGLTTGDPYSYRVSVITLSGTSAPTSPVTATVLSSIQLNPTGSAVSYNATVPVISWHTMDRNSSNWDMFIDTSNNGTAVSWFHAKAGSSTISKVLGYGVSSFSMTGTPNVDTNNAVGYGYGFQSNNGWLYFINTAKSVDHYYIGNGTKKHDFTVSVDCATAIGSNYLMVTQSSSPVWNSNTDNAVCDSGITRLVEGNTTLGHTNIGGSSQSLVSNGTGIILWEFNSTVGVKGISTTPCSLFQVNSNFTQVLLPNKIGCDWSIQQSINKYYGGMQLHKQANVYSSSASDLFNKTITLSSDTKLLMTVDSNVLGIPNNTPNVRLILHTTDGDYLVILTKDKIYYHLTSVVLNAIQVSNRAYQSYYVIPYGTTLPLQLSSVAANASVSVYATAINNTENIFGITQLISGYTYRGTSLYGYTRTVDPQWTNDQTNIPFITTSSSLFPIYLTVSNAPVQGALMVTNPAYTINSIAGVWTVTLLDATRSAEFDIPVGQCGLIYVADVSTIPTIWNYEGQVCASGTNQKTVTYVNTLPTNFFTLRYGVTDSYTPSTNGLTTSFHTTVPGTTYTVDIKNSTGTIAQTYTFTVPTNSTIDIQHYNVSGVSKPAGLFVSVAGNQIYSAYLGSPLSLASVATFFHQYLSYQGFDLLSFIPLVFAAMFTRNTVGIGAALTVVLIATLSFLSIVVIPDPVIYIGIIIAVIGLIGYRAFGY